MAILWRWMLKCKLGGNCDSWGQHKCMFCDDSIINIIFKNKTFLSQIIIKLVAFYCNRSDCVY